MTDFNMCLIVFQAFRRQKKTWRRLPPQLPPGKRSSTPGLQEDAWPQASRSPGAGALQPALPCWQAPSSAGPALPSGSEVPPGLPLSAREARGDERGGRSQLEQQENIRWPSLSPETDPVVKATCSWWTSLTRPIISSHLEREPTYPDLFFVPAKLFCWLFSPLWRGLWMISDLQGQVFFSSCCLNDDKETKQTSLFKWIDSISQPGLRLSGTLSPMDYYLSRI